MDKLISADNNRTAMVIPKVRRWPNAEIVRPVHLKRGRKEEELCACKLLHNC
jgi:hypothetical protein